MEIINPILIVVSSVIILLIISHIVHKSEIGTKKIKVTIWKS